MYSFLSLHFLYQVIYYRDTVIKIDTNIHFYVTLPSFFTPITNKISFSNLVTIIYSTKHFYINRNQILQVYYFFAFDKLSEKFIHI